MTTVPILLIAFSREVRLTPDTTLIAEVMISRPGRDD
jgi:hypothetical protein